jgi:hypothetical protein
MPLAREGGEGGEKRDEERRVFVILSDSPPQRI